MAKVMRASTKLLSVSNSDYNMKFWRYFDPPLCKYLTMRRLLRMSCLYDVAATNLCVPLSKVKCSKSRHQHNPAKGSFTTPFQQFINRVSPLHPLTAHSPLPLLLWSLSLLLSSSSAHQHSPPPPVAGSSPLPLTSCVQEALLKCQVNSPLNSPLIIIIIVVVTQSDLRIRLRTGTGTLLFICIKCLIVSGLSLADKDNQSRV